LLYNHHILFIRNDISCHVVLGTEKKSAQASFGRSEVDILSQSADVQGTSHAVVSALAHHLCQLCITLSHSKYVCADHVCRCQKSEQSIGQLGNTGSYQQASPGIGVTHSSTQSISVEHIQLVTSSQVTQIGNSIHL
jgi:hypothetical protein